MNRKDLTGRRFGRLVALEPTGQKHRSCIVWRCRCDCGKEALVPSDWLLNGAKRSCGCFQDENRRRDITGRRNGRLTAIRPTEERKNGKTVWEWRCDCGATVLATTQTQRTMCRACSASLKADQALSMFARIERTGTGAGVGQVEGILAGKLPRNNSSGVRGVSWHIRMKKWQARIYADGKTVTLGTFARLEDAVRAREEAVKKRYGKPGE